MVQLSIQVPKGIHDFVGKVAALEGSTPEKWYEHWVLQAFDAITDNGFIIEELDAEKMKHLYHYERQ
jgi:hypothetical protein